MYKYTKQILLSTLITYMLVGCGSSSNSNNSNNTGYFIDSQVAGIHYITSSGIKGTTDNYGRFYYDIGDKVKFSLGKIILGESKPNSDGLITPALLVVGDNTVPDINQTQTITLMLQTLQSLDIDNNPTNGIVVSNDIIDSLDKLDHEIKFQDINESYLIKLDHTFSLRLDENNDSSLDVNASVAKTHFETSLQEWNKNSKPDRYENGNANMFNLDNYIITNNLSQELKEALAHMGNEERLAYDIYINLYNYHLSTTNIDIKQLNNIAINSETKHIQIVRSLVDRYNLTHSDLNITNNINGSSSTELSSVSGQYNISEIQTLYNNLYDLGDNNKIAALKVGCMVEVTDINDLDNYIEIAENQNAIDITEAFKVLRAGSYTHYWSFNQELKNEGIATGCYVEGDSLLTNKSTIYPKNTDFSNKGYGYHRKN